MIRENKTIETILTSYKTKIGKDYNTYRNHIYRIFNYALTLDTNTENIEKYAIAAAFHDIGIWTHSFDYLVPSIALANKYLVENNNESWCNEIALMIDNHHKMSVYKNEFNETVETFRKADWIDVLPYFSKLSKKAGIKKTVYKEIQKAHVIKGFHWFLVKQSLKWLVKHPFDPLPMFKR